MHSMFARMGKRVRVVGWVAVQKTHTDQTINITDQYKCSHKLPVFCQCQKCFWFTKHTHLSYIYPHVTHTQNTLFDSEHCNLATSLKCLEN